MNFDSCVSIGGRLVGMGHEPFIVAELSANHNGSLDRAKEIIRLAADSGADAVKFQTYTADSITLDSIQPDFQITGGLWDGRTLHSLYSEGSLPYEWHRELFSFARELGLSVMSSPFDEAAVDFLIDLGVDALKIASFECTHLPLIEYAAGKGIPIVISTGMATQGEIDDLVNVVAPINSQLILLHCVSAYPAPPEEYGLKSIEHLAERYGCLVGLSDHCVTNEIAMASVVCGASFIEKHFTLSRSDGGLDDSFSLEPAGLKELKQSTLNIYKALSVGSEISDSEQTSLRFRRSIYCSKAIKAGDIFSTDNVRVVRPGFGLHPRYLHNLLGQESPRDIDFAEPILINDLRDER